MTDTPILCRYYPAARPGPTTCWPAITGSVRSHPDRPAPPPRPTTGNRDRRGARPRPRDRSAAKHRRRGHNQDHERSRRDAPLGPFAAGGSWCWPSSDRSPSHARSSSRDRCPSAWCLSATTTARQQRSTWPSEPRRCPSSALNCSRSESYQVRLHGVYVAELRLPQGSTLGLLVRDGATSALGPSDTAVNRGRPARVHGPGQVARDRAPPASGAPQWTPRTLDGRRRGVTRRPDRTSTWDTRSCPVHPCVRDRRGPRSFRRLRSSCSQPCGAENCQRCWWLWWPRCWPAPSWLLLTTRR
jgi:hypothetical protein